jgi:hypothetical protein
MKLPIFLAMAMFASVSYIMFLLMWTALIPH